MSRGFAEGGGSIRLFRLFGIQVFLHWSWLLVALYEIQTRQDKYGSQLWNALEYLTLFAIVLLHEFGHALACRSVGGRAERIVLWPLGGVAFVSPPQRPGAVLWSIVAGPLVNLLLAPLLWFAPQATYDARGSWDAANWAAEMFKINLLLLVFNLLPIYPLDGGKILWSLLWFIMGRGRALMVSGIVGLVGAAGFVLLALYWQSFWIGILAAFGAMQSWTGLKAARAMNRIDAIPRRAGVACPICREHPLRGPLWKCPRCALEFDMFENLAVCPQCGLRFDATNCFSCGEISPIVLWQPDTPPAPPLSLRG